MECDHCGRWGPDDPGTGYGAGGLCPACREELPTTECAWCQRYAPETSPAIIRQGNDTLPRSHGICVACYTRICADTD